MNKSIRNIFASAALAFIAAGSASAGVVTSGNNVTYTATVTGNKLDLTIDAVKNTFKNTASELDVLTFTMVGLDSFKLVSAQNLDWTEAFTNNSGKTKDKAEFTAAGSNQSLVTAPLQFSFEFTGTNLDFNALGLKAGFLANGIQSDMVTLNVTAVDATDPAAVPEPASVALLLGGLGLLSAMRRKAKRV